MVGTVLQNTVEAIGRYWRALAPVAIALGFLDALVSVLLRAVVPNIDPTAPPGSIDVGAVATRLLFGSLLAFAISLIISAVMFNLVAEADERGTPDVNHAFEVTMARIWSLVGLVLLSTLAVFVGFLLLILPGIWVAVSLAPSIAILFLEERGAVDAFQESFRLVKGSWWPIFGILIIFSIFNAALGAPGAALGGIASFVYQVIASAVVLVIQPMLILYIYRALRAQRPAAT